MTWDTSRSTSAWLARQRDTMPLAHRAWVDEALRQAGRVGALRAELFNALATVEAVLAVYKQDIYRDPRPTDATLQALVDHCRQVLARD